jgi:hypothetical protein
LRLHRSAARPKGRENTAAGASRANATTPAFDAEWVTASVSSG